MFSGESGSGAARSEPNPPIFVYDCSGPYSDPAVQIDIRQGLPVGCACGHALQLSPQGVVLGPQELEGLGHRGHAAGGGPAGGQMGGQTGKAGGGVAVEWRQFRGRLHPGDKPHALCPFHELRDVQCRTAMQCI
jgi:hypothetical protein